MTQRFLRFVMIAAALVLLAALCLLFVLYHSWSWWASLPLFFGILVSALLIRAGWRKWTTWRLKRRLARDMTPDGQRANHEAFDRQWLVGLKTLRQSRYVGQTISARRLPWILALDLHDVPGKAFAGLAVKSAPGQSDAQVGPSTIGWYFLRHSIMLHASPDLVLHNAEQPDSSWHRLLYSLNRLRRQEPLNGVALRIDIGRLLQDDNAALTELGRVVRVRLDELARVMDARMPVWIVLTGGQALPGLQDWAMALEDDRRHAVFGATLPPEQLTTSISERVRLLFASIESRLFELRIAQGMHGALAPAVFEFSLQVQRLQEPLQRMLAPAFDASPYAPAPLLQGLYVTAQGNEEKQWVPWFSQMLYDDILPAQRDAWLPLEHWRHSRRLLRRTAVATWLTLCGLFAVGIVYSWRQVQGEINTLEKRPLHQLNFDGDLENDLQTLHVWRDATVKLLNADTQRRRYLPLTKNLGDLHAGYRKQFAQIYAAEIIAAELDPLLIDVLPTAAQRGTDVELAAWAQYLIRRINLIQARLEGKPLDGLPLPGGELREILLAAGRPAPGAQASVLIGQLYRDYLMWQSQDALLRSEKDSLRAALLQLGLDTRSPTWLLAWADLQQDLQPIALSDFWKTADDPDAPHIPSGLTAAGTQAIDQFVDEWARAMGHPNTWQEREAELARRFRQASADAWFRFADYLPDARRQLPNETAWRNQVVNIMTPNDPHLAVMKQIAQVFSGLPEAERPVWAAHIIELDRLLVAAQAGDDAQSSLLDKAKLAGTLGAAQLRDLAGGATLNKSAEALNRGIDSTSHLRDYKRALQQAASQSMQGSAGAMKLATDTWGYGHDPSIQAGALHQAQLALDALRQRMGSDDAADEVVWDLLQGPLLLALDYVAQSAACQLQSRWDSNVRSAVHGVDNAAVIDDLLYGERGQVPAFLQGDVQHFIDRDTMRYKPRSALGMTVPLNSQFYAFASTAQRQQARRMQATRDQSLDAKVQQVQEQTWQEQISELDKLQTQLRTRSVRATLTGEPPLVSTSAKIRPQHIRLTLQCTEGPTTLDNFNFPVSKIFTWSEQSCAETTLEVRFQNLTLRKVFSGPYGFPDFLAAFPDGRKTFTPADFPDQAALMQSLGLDTLTVRWQVQNAAAVVALADDVRQISQALADQQSTLRAARERNLQQVISQATRSVDGNVVPTQIAHACWRQVPTAALYKAAESDVTKTPDGTAAPPAVAGAPQQTHASNANEQRWFVQVGIFGSTKKAVDMLNQAGFTHQEAPFKTGTGTSRLLFAGPFSNHEAAAAAAVRIDEALALKSLVVKR